MKDFQNNKNFPFNTESYFLPRPAERLSQMPGRSPQLLDYYGSPGVDSELVSLSPLLSLVLTRLSSTLHALSQSKRLLLRKLLL